MLLLHKGSDRTQVINYRPISLLSTFAKVFEKLIHRSLLFHTKQQIHPAQHGFFPGRSVETNLAEFTDYIFSVFDECGQVDAIYTDFSKAFDRIDHSILVAKLRDQFGISGDLLRWIESYITNRSQAVSINGFTSLFVPVTSGVPQGSLLVHCYFHCT